MERFKEELYAETKPNPKGPWSREPHYKLWGYRGFLLCCRRNPLTWSLCGYLRLPHSRRNIDDDLFEDQFHGGLTFDEVIDGHRWLGFDCGHWNDLMPHFIETEMWNQFLFRTGKHTRTYRTVEYVKNNLEACVERILDDE